MILLDTHAWVWWVNKPERLSKVALKRIDKEEELGVSVISCWEVAMLVEKGRIAFNRDVLEWVLEALNFPKIQVIDLTPTIAVLSTKLPGKIHGDPADRILIATASSLSCPLITKDNELIQYPHLETIW